MSKTSMISPSSVMRVRMCWSSGSASIASPLPPSSSCSTSNRLSSGVPGTSIFSGSPCCPVSSWASTSWLNMLSPSNGPSPPLRLSWIGIVGLK